MPADMTGAMQRARVLASNPAAAAMMVVAARHRAETGVKDVSNARAKADGKAKVMLNLTDGTIESKGVSVEDLAVEQQKAYDKPYEELAQVSERMTATGGGAAAQPQPATQATQRPAPAEQPAQPTAQPISAKAQAAAARYAATQMERKVEKEQEDAAGNQWSGVLPNIADIWRGKGQKNAYKMAQQLQYKRDEARYYDEVAKAEEDDAKQREIERKATVKGRSSARAEIGRSDLGSLTTSDVALRAGVDESALEEGTPESDSVLIDAMRSKRDELTLKGAKDAATGRRARVAGLKKEDVEGGATFDQWLADTQDQVGELSPSELSRAKAKWTTFTGKVAGDEVKAERATADQRMQTERFERAMQPKPDKPEKPSTRWSTDDIVENRGADDVDQEVLERVATTKRVRIAKSMNTNSTKASVLDAEIAAIRNEISALSGDPKAAEKTAIKVKIEEKRGSLIAKKAQRKALEDENKRYSEEDQKLQRPTSEPEPKRKQIDGHWYVAGKDGWELE